MPYAVPSLVELPGSLQQAATQSVGSSDELISICVFPVRTYLKNWDGWEYVSEQALLFTRTGVVHIQAPASPNHEARIVNLRSADLIYARLSLILMYGRLEFVDENLSRVVVEFNAAGFDIIRPGLREFLGSCCGKGPGSNPDTGLTKTVLDEIGEVSFKFKNGLYLYGLLPDEQVLGFVFQPGIWGKRWHLFPIKISEATLLALTDRQLIVVEERSQSKFPAYGWIFTFYPLKAIEKIEITTRLDRQELVIGTKSTGGLNDHKVILEDANDLAWQELWLRCGNPHTPVILPIPVS